MISFKMGASSNYVKGYCKVFGDSEEFLRTVISRSTNVIEIYDDGAFCGGACLLEVSITGDSSIDVGAYIYGAFVCKEMRGRGYFRELCAQIYRWAYEMYNFILVIPATEELFPVYERFGFSVPVNGAIPITTPLRPKPSLPKDIRFKDFDGDYNSLYFMHICSNEVTKDFNLFVSTVEDFDIKYIYHGDDEGYALFNNGRLVYICADFARYKPIKKGLIMPLTDGFSVPENLMCDILFEV